jgi:hypothetical protein
MKKNQFFSVTEKLITSAVLLMFFCPGLILPQTKDQAGTEYTLNTTITMGDQRKVIGTIQIRAPEEMTVRHSVNGLFYEKIIHIKDIKSIEILKWKGNFVRETASGQIFDFIPSEYAVVLHDGFRMIRTEEFFSFLTQVVLVNENGKLTLFTHWRDLKGTDGKWFTGSETSDNLRTVPHKDVIRSFSFSNQFTGDHE